ncbi:CerR family C-terminal domain-containing protein [Aquibium sp. A9E412]|uniref:CerR family C-terminal domain-containing protein n=1 Tax=Aquibium sp. A9E412 TaxID=2976767 RepID=UPI0025AFAB4A|nr:CerR family C-terminal domain-containing protein [Aquibium sp. A9E412]MDN2566449.1 CerR family C-terminal domain-containing protein [Aquibium sp. A9E412]
MTSPSAPHPATANRLTGAEHTRRALVRAGLVAFGEKGFEGATTRDIAAAAGANIGSIAYHFGGKQGLRAACAVYVVDTVGAIAGSVLPAGEAAPPAGPQEARAVLGRLVETMARFVVARPEAGEIVPFVLRELAQPTSALDTIYDGLFAPIHRRLCAVWAAATGEPAEADATKLAVFTLIGQVLYFRIAGEGVRRRMGWQSVGEAEAAAVAAAARANLEAMLAARVRPPS